MSVRLLMDQHLSRKLVLPLDAAFARADAAVPNTVSHVLDHALDRADDDAIWQFAASNGLTIVTKDHDFHALSFMRGHPPKVIWLRSGNGPTRQVLEVLVRSRAVIEAFHEDDERSLLTLP